VVVAIAALPVALLGCTSESGSDDLSVADAVECRHLGGGWTYTRFEAGSTSSAGVSPRVPTGPDPDDLESISDAELAATSRARDANGWDEQAIGQLLQAEPPPEVLHRLRGMPSCLDELRGETD
jgi:hypothetical protein